MKEKQIEKAVCRYARAKGFKCYKFSSPQNRGVPDRLFIHKGNIFFIEFKMAGKQPSGLQEYVINEIRKEGIFVYVVNDIETGYKIINNHAQ